jgi:hypothetical protein
MKNSSNLEILKTNKKLTIEEQNTFRQKLKPLLNVSGIKALCLEDKELYVEFNPTLLKLDSFKQRLLKAGFPIELNAVPV